MAHITESRARVADRGLHPDRRLGRAVRRRRPRRWASRRPNQARSGTGTERRPDESLIDGRGARREAGPVDEADAEFDPDVAVVHTTPAAAVPVKIHLADDEPAAIEHLLHMPDMAQRAGASTPGWKTTVAPITGVSPVG